MYVCQSVFPLFLLILLLVTDAAVVDIVLVAPRDCAYHRLPLFVRRRCRLRPPPLPSPPPPFLSHSVTPCLRVVHRFSHST